MRVFSRIVLCCAILTLATKLFAGERSASRDVRHLGQTSWARAVTLHRIDSADVPQKPGARQIEARQPLTALTTQVARSTPIRARVQQVSSIRRPPLLPPIVVISAADGEVSVSKKDPARIDFVLRRWEAASQQMKTAECDITRWVYDKVFEVDKRAVGSLAYIEDKLFVIEITPFKVDQQSKPSKKIGRNGVPFKVESATPETWVFTDKEIRVIDDAEKTMEIIPVPADAREEKNLYPFAFSFGWPLRFLNGPFPFVFSVSADNFKKRFDVSIDHEDAKTLIITLVPREARDKQNFSEAILKLDKKTFVPEAMKALDPAGNLETVYLFTNWNVSDKVAEVKDIPIAHKRYSGYKRNVMATAAPAKPAEAHAKAGLVLPAVSESRWWQTGMAAIELAAARPVTAFLIYAATGEHQ